METPVLDLAGNDQLADVQHEVLSGIHRPLLLSWTVGVLMIWQTNLQTRA